MYPNVHDDYTVVPGVTPVTDSRVTLTGVNVRDVITIDDAGNVLGVSQMPSLVGTGTTVFLGGLATILVSSLFAAVVTGLAFRAYGKRRSPMAPAIVVGVSSLLIGGGSLALAALAASKAS